MMPRNTYSIYFRSCLKSLLEAIIIVILVILLFLGSARSAFIPIITIPLSLIGNFLSCIYWGIPLIC